MEMFAQSFSFTEFHGNLFSSWNETSYIRDMNCREFVDRSVYPSFILAYRYFVCKQSFADGKLYRSVDWVFRRGAPGQSWR